MAFKISGIEAAWRAKENRGSLFVDGINVVYAEGNRTVTWPSRTHVDAIRMANLFRKATEYPGSREAVRA